ncbi:hypothetical protein PTSG_05080 [Salpingoeca rosetta]|uniref:Uncharacterized protein n=1 Tax=Salpingoeca rosetta (strain ATCC 50818 / BSB-021) TaxID=946362 RepID=F2UAG9_SALR5|nr:uncharacterized protein PTSG_05080 [Salpingoeca rosetta]EGD73385.1 hypothetical protein PTSG_05080 [Salpingoeca rosetta]|eukprot:XP_004993667.1 hypothetical protein PTSG_05080 [Salpingoeca rosetta]
MASLDETDVDTLVGAEVEAEDGHVRQIMLEARLAPSTGGVQWVLWPGSTPAAKQQAQEHGQELGAWTPGTRADPATTQLVAGWYPPMLTDHLRAELYEQAIHTAVGAFQEKHGRAPVVLDIGAGCGLLSMLAVRHGAAHAYAVEQFAGLATVAASVVACNGFEGHVTVLAKPSFEVTPSDLSSHAVDGRCDMVISELLDFSLTGEMVVPILRDAYARLLHPRAPSIPAAARLYGQLVSSPALDALRLNGCPMYTHCLPCHVQGLEPMAITSDPQQLASLAFDPCAPLRGDGPHPSSQQPVRVSLVGGGGEDAGHVRFEQHQHEGGGDGDAEEQDASDGMVVWWELSLLADDASSLVYSSAPAATTGQPFQDHWAQGLFVLPRCTVGHAGVTVRIWLEDEATTLRAAAITDLPTTMDMTTDTTEVAKRTPAPTTTPPAPSPDTTPALAPADEAKALLVSSVLHTHATVERAAAYGSGVYGRIWVAAMERSRRDAGLPAGGLEGANGIVLDMCEGGACGLLYAQHLACPDPKRSRTIVVYDAKQHVTVCPLAHLDTRHGVHQATHVGNTSSSSNNDTSVCDSGGDGRGVVNVQWWRGADHGDAWRWGQVQHVVGDTFAYQLKNRPILAALNLYYLRRAFSPAISPSAAITPHRICIRAALVRLPDLSFSHAAITTICGLDHTPLERAMRPHVAAATVGNDDGDDGDGAGSGDGSGVGVSVGVHALSCVSLWQYRRSLACAPVTVATLDLTSGADDLPHEEVFDTELPLAASGDGDDASGDGGDGCGVGVDGGVGGVGDAVVLWVDMVTGDGASGPPVVLPGYPHTRADVRRFGAEALGLGEGRYGHVYEGGPFWAKQVVYWLHGHSAKELQRASKLQVKLGVHHAMGTYTFHCTPAV